MITVIVSIYNRLDNLELILQGLEPQTYKNFEVVVSEDCDSPKTIEFLSDARNKFSFPIKHVSHEDMGFRKTRILNKAVLATSGKYLVLFDGDCLPHRKNLGSYAKYLDENTVCVGRRCYINEELTNELLKQKDIALVNTLNLMRYAKHLDHAFYIPYLGISKSNRLISGCNWAISKQLLLDVNGFDEDYTKPGVGEDHDIDWRLRKKGGVVFLNIKREVIVYHLYHKPNYNQDATNYV